MEWASFSADGTKVVAACSAGLVYTSQDSGATWNPASLPSDQWNASASSSDGSKLVVVSQTGAIETSSDFGTNWSGGIVGSRAWFYAACSTNGANLIVGNPNGPTFISANFGQTLLPTFYPGAYRCASSADGTKLFLAQFSGQIYTLQPGPPLRIDSSGGNLTVSLPDYSLSGFAFQQSGDLAQWSSVTNTPADTNGWYRYLMRPSGSNSFFRLNSY